MTTKAVPITSSDVSVSTPTVVALKTGGEAAAAFLVRPGNDSRETVVCMMDLEIAEITGNAIEPVWSKPESVIERYGLSPLVDRARTILGDVFGAGASLTPEIEVDGEGRTIMLVLRCTIAPEKRPLRSDFLRRYVRETQVPAGAPVPIIAWSY